VIDPTCIFCQIVAGDAESTVIYEDDIMVVLLDINPVTPGHTLVVPRAHMPALSDVDLRTGAHMFNVAQRVAKALRASGLPCDGINLFYADGEAANQTVFHAHLHVIPRYAEDGFIPTAERQTQPSRPELEATGEQIRNTLEAMGTER
jgi:histidine triad (HIT) family protein